MTLTPPTNPGPLLKSELANDHFVQESFLAGTHRMVAGH